MPRGAHPKKRQAPSEALRDCPLAYRRENFTGLSSKSGCLLALGSAAVLMVYVTGWERTKHAIHHFNLAAVATRVAAGTLHFKDGTYTGWGSCLHGDLQASVVIRSGRIVAASIAQCFTRYPENVIARLPGQVVARQGANIDKVSHATESSDAFFEAVAQALAKAQ